MPRRRLIIALVLVVALAAAAALAATRDTSPRRDSRIYSAQAACSGQRAPARVPRARGVPAAPRDLIVGLSANLRGARGRDRCGAAALVRAVGVRWLREDLEWARIEPRRGELRWGAYDAVVRTAAERGITLLPLILHTPAWAGPDPSALPRDPGDYAAFVAAAAARYGPGGDYWRVHPAFAARAPAVMELYNEPYLDGVDPGAFAVLARQAIQAARAANPRVGLLVPAQAGAWLDGLYAAVPDLFRAGAAGAAAHPYSIEPPKAPAAPDTTRSVELIHATMAAHGDAATPVWITEIGWATCGLRAAECVSEPAQAADLAATFRLAAGAWRPWLRAVFVYRLRDFRPRRTLDKEEWFGLLRPDGRAKPAWGVLAAVARR